MSRNSGALAGVVKAGGEELLGYGEEHIVDLALRRPDAGGTDQHQLVERVRRHGGHFGGEPSAQGETHEVCALEAEVVGGFQIPAGQVAHAHDPFLAFGCAEAGMGRYVEGVVLGEGVVAAEPALVSQLAVQDEQGRAAAALDHLEADAGRLYRLFRPCLRACRHVV